MKVLFNCHVPFMLAHGGAQVQIEQTKAALEQIGVETDYLQWWNDRQTGEILHHFGALPEETVRQAHDKGWKAVNTILLSENCNRSRRALLFRRVLIRTAMAVPLPGLFRLRFHAFRMCDRVLVSLQAEKEILVRSYGVPERSVRLVPLGLKEPFLKAGPGARTGDYLISHGTIAPVKNSVELARLAIEAKVPVLFVGKPFAAGASYWEQFRQLVDNRYVRHQPHVAGEVEMIGLLQQARGFVLNSRFENWSLAAHEAVACGLPLLLPDLPWSRERFGGQASFFPKQGFAQAAAVLRDFYQQSASAPSPKVRLYSWREVAEILRDAYTNDSPSATKAA
jgi:glycosyltransferase involved in cell wall biosynthesis